MRAESEVTDYQIYAGTAAPFNFNGLVRHYFMRRGANVADLQINPGPLILGWGDGDPLALDRHAESARLFGSRSNASRCP